MDNYHIEIDNVAPEEWASLLTYFDDANIFQSWHYGATMYGCRRLTHIVIKRDGQVVAAAQGRIVKFPFLRSGIAHFLWGPMWRRRNIPPQRDELQNILRSIYRKYAVEKRLLVRIRSNESSSDEQTGTGATAFEKEGYRLSSKPHYTTIRVDLTPSLEQLRRQFSKSWKRHLRAAEKKHFSITQGTDEAQFEKFNRIYFEMRQRKKIVKYNPEISKYRALQRALPKESKMVVFACELGQETIAANVVSTLGNTGMFLFGCSSNRAIRENLRGSYLLHWRTMAWLQKQGMRWYDLKGYDPQQYPGVSRFKSGTRGQIVDFLEFTACINRVSLATVQWAEAAVLMARGLNCQIKRVKHWLRA